MNAPTQPKPLTLALYRSTRGAYERELSAATDAYRAMCRDRAVGQATEEQVAEAKKPVDALRLRIEALDVALDEQQRLDALQEADDDTKQRSADVAEFERLGEQAESTLRKVYRAIERLKPLVESFEQVRAAQAALAMRNREHFHENSRLSLERAASLAADLRSRDKEYLFLSSALADAGFGGWGGPFSQLGDHYSDEFRDSRRDRFSANIRRILEEED